MQIPDYVMCIMNKLLSAGYECYLVGGCVRDTLMGVVPHDYDLTTSAMPSEMRSVFDGDRVIETGLKHGTLTVMSNGNPIEITTYRIDGEYDDNRHPREVSFTRNLFDDLARRDFTINAMAMSQDGEIVDLFGGREDLLHGVIKCVGDPKLRFGEDGLRIMRAVRFASTLDFEVESDTAAAIMSMRHLLSGISVERINVELSKLLCGCGAERVCNLFADVISAVLTELSPSQIRRYSYIVKELPDSDVVRRASLFTYADSPLDATRLAMLRLKCSNVERREVALCVSLMTQPPNDAVTLARFAAEMGYDLLYLVLRAMHENELLLIAQRMERDCIPLTVTELAVSGNDIVTLGARGAEIGCVLNKLLDLVISGETSNTRVDLIKMATDIIKRS